MLSQWDETAFEKGSTEYENHNYLDAIKYFKLVKQHKEITGVLYLLANCYLNIGEFTMFSDIAEKMLVIDPNCKVAHIYNLAKFKSRGDIYNLSSQFEVKKKITSFTELNFDDLTVSVFISQEIRHFEKDYEYIRVSYKTRRKKYFMHSIKDINLLIKESCEFFKCLTINAILVNSNDENVDDISQLKNKGEYFLKVVEENETVEDYSEKRIGKRINDAIYENLNNPDSVFKLILEEHCSFNFESIYPKLKNAEQTWTVQILDYGKILHYNQQKRFIEMKKYAFNLNDYLTKEYLQQNFLTTTEIIHIMKRICLGVKELHSLNIVHTDLKPDNILVEKSIESIFTAICDFDDSIDIDDEDLDWLDDILTVRSKYYAAPESYFKPVAHNLKALDFWSIGLMFIHLIIEDMSPLVYSETEKTDYTLGEYIFQNGISEIADYLTNTINDKLIDSLSITNKIQQIILGLLDTNPEKRTNLEKLEEQLEEVLHSLNSQVSNVVANNFPHELVSLIFVIAPNSSQDEKIRREIINDWLLEILYAVKAFHIQPMFPKAKCRKFERENVLKVSTNVFSFVCDRNVKTPDTWTKENCQILSPYMLNITGEKSTDITQTILLFKSVFQKELIPFDWGLNQLLAVVNELSFDACIKSISK